MVEGHQGSLVCSRCLTVAYTDVVINEAPSVDAVDKCVLCLETRAQPGWRSPLHEDAVICLRCIKQSATVVEKDKDLAWSRPTAADND